MTSKANREFYLLAPFATPDGDLPFHELTGLPDIDGWMDDNPEQYDWLDETQEVRDAWRPLPSLVERNTRCPDIFVHGSLHIYAFPRSVTDILSRELPNQFEWLPVDVRGEEAEDFEPPFVSSLSKKVAALDLHIMHCTRRVLVAEESEVVEFEPRGSKKKREVTAFLSVESYAFERSEIEGLDVFFVEQVLSVFCTKRFRDTLKRMKLKGLQFEPVPATIVG